MRLTRQLFNSGLFERIIFAVIVIGILLAGVAVVRYVAIGRQLSMNEAAQIRDSGEEVTLSNKSQAQGLMASDIERRRLLADQSSMISVGGVGLALIGLGWLLRDLSRGRRRKAASAKSDSISIPT